MLLASGGGAPAHPTASNMPPNGSGRHALLREKFHAMEN